MTKEKRHTHTHTYIYIYIYKLYIYIYTRSSGPRFARPSLLLNYSLSSYDGLMNRNTAAPVQMFVMHGKRGYAIQLPMQPKHLRSHLVKQTETTLEKVTKRVHKECHSIFLVSQQALHSGLSALSHCTQGKHVARSPHCDHSTANLSQQPLSNWNFRRLAKMPPRMGNEPMSKASKWEPHGP